LVTLTTYGDPWSANNQYSAFLEGDHPFFGTTFDATTQEAWESAQNRLIPPIPNPNGSQGGGPGPVIPPPTPKPNGSPDSSLSPEESGLVAVAVAFGIGVIAIYLLSR